jgi:hypothetical protein
VLGVPQRNMAEIEYDADLAGRELIRRARF